MLTLKMAVKFEIEQNGSRSFLPGLNITVIWSLHSLSVPSSMNWAISYRLILLYRLSFYFWLLEWFSNTYTWRVPKHDTYFELLNFATVPVSSTYGVVLRATFSLRVTLYFCELSRGAITRAHWLITDTWLSALLRLDIHGARFISRSDTNCIRFLCFVVRACSCETFV